MRFAHFASFLGDMEKSILQKILEKPAFGLIPLFVFSFLIGRIDMYVSYLVAFSLSVAGLLLVKRHSRLLYDISVVTFLLLFPLIILLGSKIDSTGIFVRSGGYFCAFSHRLTIVASQNHFAFGKE